ncbi:MAG TPA: M23 family metallopeptidase [Longimicrobiales bacterium]
MDAPTTRFGARAPYVCGALVLCTAWAVATVVAGRVDRGYAEARGAGGTGAGDVAAAPVGPAPPADVAAPRAVAEKRRPHAAADLAPPQLDPPVLGLRLAAIRDNFGESRGARRHEGVDILAPRGTPALAAVDGWVWEMKWDRRGGRTLFLMEVSGRYLLLYAHLDAYAEGLAEGRPVRRGEVVGYVGETGNVEGSAHLHLRLARIRSAERWWESEPIDPYPLLTEALAP